MADAAFYVVYIDRLEGVSYEEVKKKMDLCRSWYRLTERNWILYTTSDADKLYSRLSPLVRDEGSLFICRLDISERQGWMNNRFWDWLNRHEESS
jgi:hypothetical protein